MKKIGDFFTGLFFDPEPQVEEKMDELEEVLEQTELPPEWKELLRMRLMRVRMAIDMSRPKEDYFDFSPPGSAQFRLRK